MMPTVERRRRKSEIAKYLKWVNDAHRGEEEKEESDS